MKPLQFRIIEKSQCNQSHYCPQVKKWWGWASFMMIRDEAFFMGKCWHSELKYAQQEIEQYKCSRIKPTYKIVFSEPNS